jgi:hypothetical protein
MVLVLEQHAAMIKLLVIFRAFRVFRGRGLY